MKVRATFVAVCFLVFALAPALAKEINIASGSEITTQVGQSISSKSAKPGDQIYVIVMPPYPNGDDSFYHAKIFGHVKDVVKAGQGRNAHLGFDFDKIVLTSGATAPVTVTVTSLAETKKSNVLKIAGGALAGMLVGNYLGKLFGTNAGGAVGLATGAFLAANNKQDVTVPAGSAMKLEVLRTLALNR